MSQYSHIFTFKVFAFKQIFTQCVGVTCVGEDVAVELEDVRLQLELAPVLSPRPLYHWGPLGRQGGRWAEGEGLEGGGQTVTADCWCQSPEGIWEWDGAYQWPLLSERASHHLTDVRAALNNIGVFSLGLWLLSVLVIYIIGLLLSLSLSCPLETSQSQEQVTSWGE